MSLLARARATKAIDQQAMAAQPGGIYVPLYDRTNISAEHLTTGPNAALNIATFYACVRVLSEGVAMAPLFLYRRLPGGGREQATDHPLFNVLHRSPNPSMTSFVWRELMMSHLTTWGDAYNEITFDPLDRMQLWPVRPDRITARWGPGAVKLYDYLNPNGTRTTFKPGSIFHVQGMSPDGLRGYSPVELHRRVLAAYNATRDFGESYFRNGARPAVVMKHPKSLSDGAITRLAGQMDELRGAKNSGKTVILEEGLDIAEIGVPPETAQYIQTRVQLSRDITTIMNVKPHKVGDLERATFSNIEEQNIEHVTDSLMPWMERIEQEIDLQLIDEADIYAKHNVKGFMRGKEADRSASLAVRWQHGTLNADEWREIEDENPLPNGEGQAYYVPVNYAVADGTPAETSAATPVQLRAVKSATVRCQAPECGKLLIPKLNGTAEGICPRCKTPYTATSVA